LPVTRTIDVAQGTTAYKEGTSRAGAKLVRKFNAVTGIVDAATSATAIANFKANVTSDLAIAVRTAKLKAAGDAGLHKGMTDHGSTNYTTRTGQVADKWATNFGKYATPLQSIVSALPARTSDPASNVSNRVTPIATGLRAAKKALYGVP